MPELMGELPVNRKDLSCLLQGLDDYYGVRSGDLTNEEEAEIAELRERMVALLTKLDKFYKRGKISLKGKLIYVE